VTDGISAQAIARSPDKDAGEAVRRVTGITVVGGKYLVVRGLGERYSNALLNGAEMPNPVIEKKIAPLDIFPAGLLERRGRVEDRDSRQAGRLLPAARWSSPPRTFRKRDCCSSASASATPIGPASVNCRLAPRGGTDWLGIDDGRRAGPYVPFSVSGAGRDPAAAAVRFTTSVESGGPRNSAGQRRPD